MALNDVKWFAQGLHDLGNKLHDLDGDDLRLAIVTGAIVPNVSTDRPHFGGTGVTNFATSQVALGTGYSGPIALASKTWLFTPTGPVLDIADIVIPADAVAGFANGAYGIIFNNSNAEKRGLAYIELSDIGTYGNIASARPITPNIDGLLKLTQV